MVMKVIIMMAAAVLNFLEAVTDGDKGSISCTRGK